MRQNSLAWIVIGGSLFGLTSLELAACSASGGGTGNPSGSDATASKDGVSGDGAKTDGSGSNDAGTEAASECGTLPTLHPRPVADGGDGGLLLNFFCPFSSPKGVAPEYCTSGSKHCCVPFTTGVLSTCETACPAAADGGPFNGRDFACLDNVDCLGGGKVCCAMGQSLQDPVCLNYFGKSFKGSKCATSCDTANDEFAICQSDDQCSGGKTCQPMSAVGAQFGFCQ